MKTFKSILIGAIYGIVTSMLFSFLFVIMGQIAAGAVTGLVGEYWLYISTLAPFTLGFAILGYIFSKNISFNKKIGWVYSCIIAFIVTFYVSTIGALIGEHFFINDGMGIYERYVFYEEYRTDDNTFYWGLIYAIVLLPLTTIIARYLIKLFELILISINGKSFKNFRLSK